MSAYNLDPDEMTRILTSHLIFIFVVRQTTKFIGFQYIYGDKSI